MKIDVKMTWLGHGTFLFQYDGTTMLIDPWVQNNPACPDELKSLKNVDLMLITHGHFDHIADAVSIAHEHTPQVVGIFETCAWLEKRGVQNTHGMNKGGTLRLGGIDITMVHADHSCGIQEDDGTIIYGGEAVGFVLRFPDGFCVYHAGDTNVFGDMALIQELYQPDVALLPVGDHFTMGPWEARKAIDLLNVKHVIPMHFGTFPLLTGTPEALRELTHGMSVNLVGLKPGEAWHR